MEPQTRCEAISSGTGFPEIWRGVKAWMGFLHAEDQPDARTHHGKPGEPEPGFKHSCGVGDQAHSKRADCIAKITPEPVDAERRASPRWMCDITDRRDKRGQSRFGPRDCGPILSAAGDPSRRRSIRKTRAAQSPVGHGNW